MNRRPLLPAGVAGDDEPPDPARLMPLIAALSEPTRLSILLAVADHPRSVKALAEAVGLPGSLTSHHLAVLRRAGLVDVTARGRSNINALCCPALSEPARLAASGLGTGAEAVGAGGDRRWTSITPA